MARDSQPTNILYLILMLAAATLVLVLGLLLGGLYLLFQVAAVTWPACGGAVVLVITVLCSFYALRIRYLERSSLLATTVLIRCRDEKLEFEAVESKMKRLAKAGSAVFTSVLCALLWCSALIYILYRRGVFSDITWWFYGETVIVSPVVSVVLSGCICCALIILALLVVRSNRIYRYMLSRIINSKLKHLNDSIKGLDELMSLDTFFDTICDPLNLRADITYHLGMQRDKLLSFSPVAIDRLNSLIAERVRMAKKRKEMYAPADDGGRDYGTSVGGMTVREARRILNVGEDATCEEIKQAYRLAVKKWNVDQRQHLEPHIKMTVEEQFKKVNAAYEILSKSA